MSSTEGGEPEWRMEAVEWDPVDMTARPRAEGSGGGAGMKKNASSKTSSARSANYCCQVEGCPRQLLPLRSYYQRQHICEEHFRALAITDASGRVSRFCQQCTKLEPLRNYDGERRSCRMSLERRNQRRQSKRNITAAATAAARSRRTSAGAKGTRQATTSPSSGSDVPASNSNGSGSGSVTRVNGESPTAFAAQPSMLVEEPGLGPGWKVARGPTVASASEACTLQAGSPIWAPSGTSLSLPQGAAGPSTSASGAPVGITAFWMQQVGVSQPQAQAQAQSDHSASFYVPLSPYLPAAAPSMTVPQRLPFQQQPPHLLAAAVAPVAATAPLAGGLGADVHVAGMGDGLAGLSSFDIDQLLALDADSLANAILQTSTTHLPLPLDSQVATSSTMDASLPLLLPSSHQCQQQQQQWQAAVHTAPATTFAAPQAWASVSAAPPAEVPPQPRACHESLVALSNGLQLSPAAAVVAQQGYTYRAPASATGAMPTAQLSPMDRMAVAQLLGDIDGLVEAELEALLLPDLGAPDLDEARICFKFYGMRPEQLPPQLRGDLMSALALPDTLVQASMRSGCVHLTLTALLNAEERARLAQPGAAAAVLVRLLPLAQQLPSGRVVAQVGTSSAALLAHPGGGRPALLLSIPLGGEGGAAMPTVAPASPLATTVSAAGGRFRLRCTRALLRGRGAATSAAPLGLQCRRGGWHMAVSLALVGLSAPKPGDASAEEHLSNGMADSGGGDGKYPMEADEEAFALTEEEEAAAGGPGAVVEAEAFVPDAAPEPEEAGTANGMAASFWQPGWGLYEFEVSQGALVGEALPILVLPDRAAAACAEMAGMAPSALSASLLRLVGALLGFLEAREAAAAGDGQAMAAFQARYPALAVARLAAAARKLLDVAERTRWPALAALLLPAATADGWRPARAQAPTGTPRDAPAATVAAATDEPDFLVGHKGSPRMPLSITKPGPGLSVARDKTSSNDKLAGGDAAMGAPVPELSFRDGQQRVMHPAVLGVGVVLVTGHLV